MINIYQYELEYAVKELRNCLTMKGAHKGKWREGIESRIREIEFELAHIDDDRYL